MDANYSFHFSGLPEKVSSLENENLELKGELLRMSTVKSNLELKLQKQKATHSTLMMRIQELRKIKRKYESQKAKGARDAHPENNDTKQVYTLFLIHIQTANTRNHNLFVLYYQVVHIKLEM